MWKNVIILLCYNAIFFSIYNLLGFNSTIIFALATICSILINPTIYNRGKKIIRKPTAQQFYTTNKKQTRR